MLDARLLRVHSRADGALFRLRLSRLLAHLPPPANTPAFLSCCVLRRVAVTLLLALVPTSSGADLAFSRDVTTWEEVTVPPESDSGAFAVWWYAARGSKHLWHVSTDEGKVRAQLASESSPTKSARPIFTPEVDELGTGSKFAPVDDGWLVGFDRGEFGAAVYWFSRDGKDNYKISNHHIRDFVILPNGIYAIEGSFHMMGWGAVIHIARPNTGAHWQAQTVVDLHSAPHSVSIRRDGAMLIVLSKTLVSVGTDGQIHSELSEVPWRWLYSNSSVLLPDESKLYLGMQQFVGEFDFATKRFRLLVPSVEFLNRLPEDQEEQIRTQFSGRRDKKQPEN